MGCPPPPSTSQQKCSHTKKYLWLPSRLEELFTVDVEATVAEFNKALDSAPIDPSDNWEHLKIIQESDLFLVQRKLCF